MDRISKCGEQSPDKREDGRESDATKKIRGEINKRERKD
jgi:hypothetical protein